MTDPPQPSTAPASTVVQPMFKLVLIAVICFFAVSLTIDVVMSVLIDEPKPSQQHAIELLDLVAKTTLGAILGLLGGKAQTS